MRLQKQLSNRINGKDYDKYYTLLTL